MVNGAKTKSFFDGGIAEVEGSSPELVTELIEALPDDISNVSSVSSIGCTRSP